METIEDAVKRVERKHRESDAVILIEEDDDRGYILVGYIGSIAYGILVGAVIGYVIGWIAEEHLIRCLFIDAVAIACLGIGALWGRMSKS